LTHLESAGHDARPAAHSSRSEFRRNGSW